MTMTGGNVESSLLRLSQSGLRRFGDRVTACFEKRKRAGRMFYYGIRPRALPAKEAPPD